MPQTVEKENLKKKIYPVLVSKLWRRELLQGIPGSKIGWQLSPWRNSQAGVTVL